MHFFYVGQEVDKKSQLFIELKCFKLFFIISKKGNHLRKTQEVVDLVCLSLLILNMTFMSVFIARTWPGTILIVHDGLRDLRELKVNKGDTHKL